MINPDQFRELVIWPTLKYLGMYSESAVNLLLGTAAHESKLSYLKQINGPALGVYQIEPATHKDVYDNFLGYRLGLREKVLALASNVSNKDIDNELIVNLAYATAIARLIYYRIPEPLPDADDVPGMADYWKRHYNTVLGRGTVEQFIEAFPK